MHSVCPVLIIGKEELCHIPNNTLKQNYLKLMQV